MRAELRCIIVAAAAVQPRDGVVHVSKFDCREYGAGGSETALCVRTDVPSVEPPTR